MAARLSRETRTTFTCGIEARALSGGIYWLLRRRAASQAAVMQRGCGEEARRERGLRGNERTHPSRYDFLGLQCSVIEARFGWGGKGLGGIGLLFSKRRRSRRGVLVVIGQCKKERILC